MAIKALNIKLLLLALVIFLYHCTPAKFGCDKIHYNFEIGAMAFPDKDSIDIGDTIWITVDHSVNLRDKNSNKNIVFNNAANLGMGLRLLEFLPDNEYAGAINKFKFKLINGSKVNNNYDPSSLQEYLFALDDGYYSFKLALIAQDTGRFVITISNANNVYIKGDACTKAFFEIDYVNTDQHFYFLNLWRPDLTLDDKGKKKVYYFISK